VRAACALGALLLCAACSAPRIASDVPTFVLDAPDCEANLEPPGWLLPSDVAVRGGHAEPPTGPGEDVRPVQWLSGARSWLLVAPPEVAQDFFGIAHEPKESDGEPIPVGAWDDDYRPAFAERRQLPGGRVGVWLYVDLDAWCALGADRPAGGPLWISTPVETRTLLVSFE
jgi:hypothetical protein